MNPVAAGPLTTPRRRAALLLQPGR